MKLSYNGVDMEMVEIKEYTRDAVYDPSGTDLLYVKHRLGAVCTLGPGGWPQGVSLKYLPDFPKAVKGDVVGSIPPVNNPVRGDPVDPNPDTWGALKETPFNTTVTEARTNAFVTDHEVRMRLMQPRQKLKITAYSASDGNEYVWLESPRAFPAANQLVTRPITDSSQYGLSDKATDAHNGPIPLKCDVIEAVGEGMEIGVYFVVETCLVPTPGANERLVLSHRWTVRHEQDDDHYLTRVTTGEVIFNTSILYSQALQPDWFRNQFFHPIPLGFRRKVPVVEQSPDGSSIRYVITDVDTEVTFDPGDSGATQIQIQETLNLLVPNKLAAGAIAK